MSGSEREFLEQILRTAPTSARRWKEGAENAFILFAILMVVFAAGWWGVNWVIRNLARLDVGLNSAVAPWVIALGIVVCGTYAAVSTVRWIRRWKDPRPLLSADINGGQVVEETYHFTAAKRFQEPEHGGLFYFLRTTDDRVFVLYDAESQDLGVQPEDPLASTFKPCTHLLIVRAPNTGYVISKHFSGEPLMVGDPRELAVGPKEWPDSDAYCGIPWQQLETRLGKAT